MKKGYPLMHEDNADKSHFFNLLGYESNDEDKEALYHEIMDGADFAKMKFSKFNRFGLFVRVPTKIHDRTKRRHIRITTIWRYDAEEHFNFVTSIPKILEA